MKIIKTYEEFVNEMAKYTDKGYKAPFWRDNGTIRTVTNGDELRDLLTKPGFSFAYGRMGGEIAYVTREKMLKESNCNFVLSDDEKEIQIIGKNKIGGEEVIETLVLDDYIDPIIKRAALRGANGNFGKTGKFLNNKANTDFDLIKVTHMRFQFLNKDKVYGETMASRKDYAMKYASTPDKIEEYIETYPSEWDEHLKVFLSNNEVDEITLERIKTNPTKEEFVDIVTAKKTPWAKKDEFVPIKNTQPNYFSMAYKKDGDGDYKVIYDDADYYVLFNVYDVDGEIIGQDYSKITSDIYYRLARYFCATVSPKKEKEITNELDKALKNIDDEYILRNYIYDHILMMSFSYRMKGNKDVFSMIFVNEKMKASNNKKGYFDDEVFDELVNKILEPAKEKYRDRVNAEYHTF